MADEQTAEGARRFRSPPYPNISLAKAIERTKQLYTKALHHPVGVPVLAESWDYKAKSSGLWATAAALLQYGLLTDEGSGNKRKFTLTDKALRIVRDPNPESEKRAAIIKAAALTPKIFAELWQSYGFQVNSLSDMVIKSHLTVERSDNGLAPYSDAAADEVTRVYRETIAFAKLSGSDTLPADSEEKGPDGEANDTSKEKPDPKLSAQDRKPPPPPPEPQGKVTIMASERVVFTEESNPQNYLKLVASGEVDETMLEALEDYVKRQKKRLEREASKGEAAN